MRDASIPAATDLDFIETWSENEGVETQYEIEEV